MAEQCPVCNLYQCKCSAEARAPERDQYGNECICHETVMGKDCPVHGPPAQGVKQPFLDEGDLPSASYGLELPREQILEMALADAYGRIEQLVEEREPTLRTAEKLILSLEKREAIGADWHPFFDQWLRTYVDWAYRMGGDEFGGRVTTANLIRSLFAKLSGFEPQKTPDPETSHYLSMIGEPLRDQDRPRTDGLPIEPSADGHYQGWERPEPGKHRKPRTVRNKNVTHEVVTRFNVESGYVEWRGHRVVTGEAEVTPEVLAQRVLEQLRVLGKDEQMEANIAYQMALTEAKQVVCQVMAGVDVGDILDAVKLQKRVQELEVRLGQPAPNAAMERLQDELHSAQGDRNEAENRASGLEEQRDEYQREAAVGEQLLGEVWKIVEQTMVGAHDEIAETADFEAWPREGKSMADILAGDIAERVRTFLSGAYPDGTFPDVVVPGKVPGKPWWAGKDVVGYLLKRGWAIYPDGMRPAAALEKPAPFIPESWIIGSVGPSEREAERLERQARNPVKHE